MSVRGSKKNKQQGQAIVEYMMMMAVLVGALTLVGSLLKNQVAGFGGTVAAKAQSEAQNGGESNVQSYYVDPGSVRIVGQ